MHLFFPQWQGAGPSDAIQRGAERVRGELADLEFRDLPGFTSEPSARENGIQNHHSVLTNLRAATAFLRESRPQRLFTLGGDCSVEIAPIASLLARHGSELTVVWLDAHGDVNTPESSPSGTLHGMPARILLGEGDDAILRCVPAFLEPGQLIYAGVRELDPPEAAYLESRSIRRVSVADLEEGPDALLAAIPRGERRKVYVHIDVDVTDPRELPGVACPTPGGISRKTLRALVDGLVSGFDVVGGGVVELTDDAPIETVAFAAELFRALDPVP